MLMMNVQIGQSQTLMLFSRGIHTLTTTPYQPYSSMNDTVWYIQYGPHNLVLKKVRGSLAQSFPNLNQVETESQPQNDKKSEFEKSTSKIHLLLRSIKSFPSYFGLGEYRLIIPDKPNSLGKHVLWETFYQVFLHRIFFGTIPRTLACNNEWE